MCASSLPTYFAAFAQLLDGNASVADMTRAVGDSPSGSERVRFYRELSQRRRSFSLRAICPALHHATTLLGTCAWADLVGDYARRHPPKDVEPNRFAQHLADFIEAERGRGAPWPSYLAELADYEYRLWSVGVSSFEPSSTDIGLERALFVRHYDHDVPAFTRAAARGSAVAPPTQHSTLVVLYRDPVTLLPRSHYATRITLAAIARRSGCAVDERIASAAALDEMDHALTALGIFSAEA